MTQMGPIAPDSVPTATFEWGVSKWLVTPATGAALTAGVAVLQPGLGHGRHNHPDSEEILYVISGDGSQMVDDAPPFPLAAGDVVYVPAGIYHATYSASWEPLRLFVVHNPAGAEATMTALPGFVELPPGTLPRWSRLPHDS